jgi:hypothetical protein
MGMYTDWGNLQIVSCVAWQNGAGPGSSTAYQWNGRVGGVHFRLRREPREFAGAIPLRLQGAEAVRTPIWVMRETSGSLVPAFDSEAVGEFA